MLPQNSSFNVFLCNESDNNVDNSLIGMRVDILYGLIYNPFPRHFPVNVTFTYFYMKQIFSQNSSSNSVALLWTK